MRIIKKIFILLLFFTTFSIFAQEEDSEYELAEKAIIRDHYLFNTSFDAAIPVKLGRILMNDADFQRTGFLWEMTEDYTALSLGIWNWEVVSGMEISAKIRLMGDLDSMFSGIANPGNFFLPAREKEVYTQVFDKFQIGSLNGSYCTHSSYAFNGQVLILNHVQIGYEREHLGYRIIAESNTSDYERVESVDVMRNQFYINLRNLGKLDDIELYNTITFSDNYYEGTNSIFSTGFRYIPFVELNHFPLESDLYVGSLYFDIPLYIANLCLKPTLLNRDPWFSSINAFLDFAPLIELIMGNDPTNLSETRKDFLETGEGFLYNVGIGYEYFNSYPFGINPEMDYHGFSNIYFSINFVAAFTEQVVFFFEYSTYSDRIGSKEVSLDDQFEIPNQPTFDSETFLGSSIITLGITYTFGYFE